MRRVTLSGVFVLALVLLWAAVLLPALLRRHDAALARSAERLSNAVRVLQRPPRRPGPGPGASAFPVDLPDRVDAGRADAETAGGSAGGAPAVEPATPAPPPVTERVPAGAPVLAPAAVAARRRRRVLVVLVLLTLGGAGAGPVVGAAGWAVAGVGALALVAFLLAARRAVRASARPALVRAVAARPTPATPRAADPEPVPVTQQAPVTVPAPAPPVEDVFDQELLDAHPAEPALPARQVEPAAVLAGAVPAPRRRRPFVTADGTWTPVPVPMPVYLTAPRVPYPSTPRRPVPAARTRQVSAARQRATAGYGVRRAVGS